MTKISKTNIKYLEENYGKTILPLSIFQNEYIPGSEPLELLFSWNRESTAAEIKGSLFRAVEHYNLFSSRLIMIDDNKYALQYCTDGVKFNFLPPINATFDSINIDDIKRMMVHVKTLPGEPLLVVTIIPVTGGRYIGISCSDATADFHALILLCFAWKCIIEGNDFPFPSTQRLFTGQPISSDKIDKAFIPPLPELNDAIRDRVKSSNIKTYTKREYFSDEFLNEIKNKVKSESEEYIISDSQIITSFLLKRYHNDILPDTEKIILRNPVNLRDVNPDIDMLYIGNAFFDNTTEFTKDEINKMSISQIAYRLKESVDKTRDKNYIKKISYLSKYGIEFKTDVIKNYSFYNLDTDIVSSNLIHLNDPESLGLGANLVNILYISASPTSFIMLKEKSGSMFAQITSRYPVI
jgi:hypothetical protein